MEKVSVYDVHRQRTMKIKARGDVFGLDEFHQVVHVAIINSKNQLLIQQRHPHKESWPNCWDITCGGSSLVNETSQQAIERELFEELGIQIDFSVLRPKFTINFSFGFDDFYVIEKDIDLSQCDLQTNEVTNIRWANQHEIGQMIDEGLFINYRKEIIGLLFSMKDNFGDLAV